MMPIDFIITWVDSNDSAWQKEKTKYQLNAHNDSRLRRYREWDTLKYWFRSIEKFAPWVNKIFFVTCGHLPQWLDTNNPKLLIVNHKDYIPEEFLPTFSSRPIDLNFHRIKDLSEHFVYFNDDMFLLKPTKPSDFFIKGLPCDTAILNINVASGIEKNGRKISIEHAYATTYFDTMIINQNFNKKKTILQNFNKWFSPLYGLASLRTLLLLPWKSFPGFMSYHMPYSYLKSIYAEVWEKETTALTTACMHKFRQPNDVNHWLFSYWQIVSGKFSPRIPNLGKQLDICDNSQDNVELFNSIRMQKYKAICINDTVNTPDYEQIKTNLQQAFESVFPNKSSFEK